MENTDGGTHRCIPAGILRREISEEEYREHRRGEWRRFLGFVGIMFAGMALIAVVVFALESMPSEWTPSLIDEPRAVEVPVEVEVLPEGWERIAVPADGLRGCTYSVVDRGDGGIGLALYATVCQYGYHRVEGRTPW